MFYKIYVLELENNNWYVGVSKDPDQRLLEHVSGPRGAQWTRLHKPIKIHEVLETKTFTQRGAAQYENMVTLQYALKYGEDKVRGGRYSSAKKPNYPI